MAALQLFQLPLSSAASQSTFHPHHSSSISLPALNDKTRFFSIPSQKKRAGVVTVLVGREDLAETPLPISSTAQQQEQQEQEGEGEQEPHEQDLEYVRQVQRVLELLKKNRDMLFSEVKLTVMIEDPREVERRRLLGIEDLDGPTRDDFVEALEQVNEGKIPSNRVALRMLAEEMNQWPNLEVEAPKKKPSKSLYAKATDTGVTPDVAAKRLNVDWDSAAKIDDAEVTDETEVPPAVGYGALYLVTAFPIIIGVSVVLILFYNSLQ